MATKKPKLLPGQRSMPPGKDYFPKPRPISGGPTPTYINGRGASTTGGPQGPAGPQGQPGPAGPPGPQGEAAGSLYLYKSAAVVSIVNNTTEASLFFGGAFTIPANTLVTDGEVMLVLIPFKFMTTAAPCAVTVKVKVGGVTIFEDATPALSIAPSSRIGSIKLEIMRKNSNSATALLDIMISPPSNATNGLGDLAVPSVSGNAGFDGLFGTWANALPLDITFTLSSAIATTRVDTMGAVIRK